MYTARKTNCLFLFSSEISMYSKASKMQEQPSLQQEATDRPRQHVEEPAASECRRGKARQRSATLRPLHYRSTCPGISWSLLSEDGLWGRTGYTRGVGTDRTDVWKHRKYRKVAGKGWTGRVPDGLYGHVEGRTVRAGGRKDFMAMWEDGLYGQVGGTDCTGRSEGQTLRAGWRTGLYGRTDSA